MKIVIIFFLLSICWIFVIFQYFHFYCIIFENQAENIFENVSGKERILGIIRDGLVIFLWRKVFDRSNWFAIFMWSDVGWTHRGPQRPNRFLRICKNWLQIICKIIWWRIDEIDRTMSESNPTENTQPNGETNETGKMF